MCTFLISCNPCLWTECSLESSWKKIFQSWKTLEFGLSKYWKVLEKSVLVSVRTLLLSQLSASSMVIINIKTSCSWAVMSKYTKNCIASVAANNKNFIQSNSCNSCNYVICCAGCELLFVTQDISIINLTLPSPPVSNDYTSKRSGPYWSNPPYLIFWHSGTLALWPNVRKLKRMA